MTSKEVKKNFGKKLQKLRDNKHLTQEELSEILECSPEAVRHWEQGRILPTPKNLFKICDFFNCDVAYLFAIIEEKTYELLAIYADEYNGFVYALTDGKNRIYAGSRMARTGGKQSCI